MLTKLTVFCCIFLMLFTSCNIQGGLGNSMILSRLNELNYSTTDKDAEATLKLITEAISQQDVSALKACYSPVVLENISDFEQTAEELCACLDGEIVSFEKIGINEKQHVHYDSVKNEYIYIYNIFTEHTKYILVVFGINKDTEDAESVGVHAIRLRDEESEPLKLLGTRDLLN